MGKRELVALLNLSSWCPVMVEWLFLAVPWGCLRFVIVVFPDHTHTSYFSDEPWLIYPGLSLVGIGGLPLLVTNIQVLISLSHAVSS